MKITFLISFIFLNLLFAGCRQEVEKPKLIQKENKVQREIFDVKKYPELTAVGTINFIPRKQCTLILVAEDIAVTAGHCFLEEFHLSDISKDLDPLSTSVIFRYDGFRRFENISVKRVLKAKRNPDYAIVRLNKKIDSNILKPLKFEKMSLKEMVSNEQSLGCAGFNGDYELGDGGFTMTISRNISNHPGSEF